MSKPSQLGTLGEKIKQSGFGKLKQLAFLNFKVREYVNKVLESLGLDKQDIDQIQIFVKLDDAQSFLNIKIQSENRTLLAVLKTNVAVFEEKLKEEHFNLEVGVKIG